MARGRTQEAEEWRRYQAEAVQALYRQPDQGGAATLKNVLEFLHPDVRVAALPEEARRRWWAFLTVLMPPVLGGWATSHTGRFPSAATLARIQRELRAGIAALLEGREWRLPLPSEALVRRQGNAVDWATLAPKCRPEAPAAKGVPGAWYQWLWRADEEAMISLAVAGMIVKYGERLRACAAPRAKGSGVCGAPFLAVKRQLYCRPECTLRGQRQAARSTKEAKA